MSIEFTLSPIYILPCIIIGFLFSIYLYKDAEYIKDRIKYLLVFLRTFFIGTLLFILLNLSIILNKNHAEKPILILAQDKSSSIKDTSIVNLFSKTNILLNDFNIYNFSFDQRVYEGFSKKNDGLKTNFSNLFNDINLRFENKNVAAMVVSSDGIYNTGSNPIFSDNFSYPIYTILQGDTTINAQDVAIKDVRTNEIVLFKNNFPVEIVVTANKFKGEKIKLTVEHNNQIIYNEDLYINSENDFKKINLKLAANKIGLQKYVVKTSVFKNEQNKLNNKQFFYIDVVRSEYSILILKDKSHPDISSFKNAIENNKKYSVKMMDIENFNNDFNDYDLVTFFINSNQKKIINSALDFSKPLLIFDPNNYVTDNFINNIKTNTLLKTTTSLVNNRFNKFLISDSLRQFINNSPPIFYGDNAISFSDEHILLFDRLKNPLIFFLINASNKIAFVNSEGFWKWRLLDFKNNKNHNNFNEFFIKIVQYLTIEREQDQFIINHKKSIEEGERMKFEALIFNDSYELDNSQDVFLTISDSLSVASSYKFSRVNNKYQLTTDLMRNGSYTYSAVLKDKKEKTGFFEVVKMQLEDLNVIPNHNFLKNISKKSSGKFFYPNEIDQLLKELQQKNKFQDIIHNTKTKLSLIDLSNLLLILLFFISLEWIVRKYNNLI